MKAPPPTAPTVAPALSKPPAKQPPASVLAERAAAAATAAAVASLTPAAPVVTAASSSAAPVAFAAPASQPNLVGSPPQGSPPANPPPQVIPRTFGPVDDPDVVKVVSGLTHVLNAHLDLHSGKLVQVDTLRRKLNMCREEMKVHFLQYPPLGGRMVPNVDRVFLDFLDKVLPAPPAAAPQPQQQEGTVSSVSSSPTPVPAKIVPKVPVIPQINTSASKAWADIEDSEPGTPVPPPRPLHSPAVTPRLPPGPPEEVPTKTVDRDASAGVPPVKAASNSPVGTMPGTNVDDGTRVAPSPAQQAVERENARALYLAECGLRWNQWTDKCHEAYLRAQWVNNRWVFTPPLPPPKYTPDGKEIYPELAQALMEYPPAHSRQAVPHDALQRAQELKAATSFLGRTPVSTASGEPKPPPPPGPPPAWVKEYNQGLCHLPSSVSPGAPCGFVPPGGVAAPAQQPVFTGPAPVSLADGSTQTTPDLLVDLGGSRVVDPVLHAMQLSSQLVILQKDALEMKLSLERSRQRVSQLEQEAEAHESLQDELDDLRVRLRTAEAAQVEVKLKDQVIREVRGTCDRLEQDLFASRAACKSAEDELEALRLGAEGATVASPFATSARAESPGRQTGFGVTNLPPVSPTSPVDEQMEQAPPALLTPDDSGPGPNSSAPTPALLPERFRMNSSESSSSSAPSEASTDWDEERVAALHALANPSPEPAAAPTVAGETGPVSLPAPGDAADQDRSSLGGMD